MTAQTRIVIPAYNEQDLLPRAVASVRGQTIDAWEVVIVDDGSTDQTGDIARQFASADRRITVTTQPNGGLAAARNTGAADAHTDWLLFLDSDDEILPTHLENLLDAAHPDARIVHSGGYRRWNDEIGPDEFPVPNTPGSWFPTLAKSNPFFIHMCLFRRETFEKTGGFDASLRSCEDWDLLQLIARCHHSDWPSTGHSTAVYWQRPTSLIRDPTTMISSGRHVIGGGHREDPRAFDAPDWSRQGIDPEWQPLAEFFYLLWLAGVCAASQHPPPPIPSLGPSPYVHSEHVHSTFLRGVQAGLVIGPRAFGAWLAANAAALADPLTHVLRAAELGAEFITQTVDEIPRATP